MASNYWLLTDLSFSTDASFSTDTELSVGGRLDWNPYPTEFVPHSEIKIAGTGDLVGLGYFQFKWVSGEGILTAAQWYWLMSFFSGWEPSVDVYLRTRTDRTTLSVFGDREFEYRWFSAKMHRPTAESYHGYRYRNVEIRFTHAQEV